MNKLLSANFFRLRKNKCFRGSLAFMFVIGIAIIAVASMTERSFTLCLM